MIPPFDATGNLPPGVHVAAWDEVEARFGTNAHRKQLLEGLADVLAQLQISGCRRAYIDGSFVTAEPFPADYDVCYEARGVDPTYLDPVFFNMQASRAAQKAKYGGEFFPSSWPAAPGYSFFQFFQVDKQTGAGKGIVRVDLGSGV